MKKTTSELESVVPTFTGVCAAAAETPAASAMPRLRRRSAIMLVTCQVRPHSFGQVQGMSTDRGAGGACEIAAAPARTQQAGLRGDRHFAEDTASALTGTHDAACRRPVPHPGPP